MSLMHHVQRGTVSTSGGTATVSITCGHSLLDLIYIKPTTATTTFSATLTDIYSVEVYQKSNSTGEMIDHKLVPCYGNLVLSLSASADEAFEYQFVFRES